MNAQTYTSTERTILRKAALIAGFSSILLAIAAIIAEFYARQQLIVPDDAAETAQRIIAGQTSFRIGIFGFAIALICDLLISWALYVFLKSVNKNGSLLTAWFRLIYTAIFAMAIVELVNGNHVLTDGNLSAVMEPNQLQALALNHFQAFDNSWAIGFLFFGIHLLLLGYLAVKSGFIPQIIGILLLIAGTAYFVSNLAKLIMPNYRAYEAAFTAVVAIPSVIGELSLAIWLLVKGGKKAI
ncbi:MAG: hypothetical protein A3D31_07230 [Candidatus Fluviicola riflensis]|nr:MAG: hypothetical protein A3D31_07230 [Candidatus Fluviicola riflensis]OGS87279.1 MAG: hypothetical protein A2724_06690 [Fluviicola sp. RIFCSPHIGHO2_01_FULL_43_53]OGS90038.1 MAG: hypothetical protein A3E30_03435 [Fluviicola sp. RIFCSPHIGHO2_12_FULL_43_24]